MSTYEYLIVLSLLCQRQPDTVDTNLATLQPCILVFSV